MSNKEVINARRLGFGVGPINVSGCPSGYFSLRATRVATEWSALSFLATSLASTPIVLLVSCCKLSVQSWILNIQ